MPTIASLITIVKAEQSKLTCVAGRKLLRVCDGHNKYLAGKQRIVSIVLGRSRNHRNYVARFSRRRIMFLISSTTRFDNSISDRDYIASQVASKSSGTR